MCVFLDYLRVSFPFKVNKISYITGTTMSVKSVEEISPPMTVAAIPLEIKIELSCPNNNGNNAPIVAIAVIKIGRIRMPPASINASFIDMPACSLLITRSINTIALVTTIPININTPIKLGTEIVSPVMSSANTTPITV